MPAPTPLPTAPRRPRSTRRVLAALVAAAIAAVALAGCWSTNQSKVLNLVNASRTSYGLAKVRGDDTAMKRAQEWSNHMAVTGVLAHRGTWSGLGSWCAAAENVGYGPDTTTVQNAFMRSAPHRANILGRYDRVGTGVTRVGSLVWVTQIFLRSC